VPDYFNLVNDNIAVLVQIESRAGVAAASSIAAVDGIDGLFIGPSDLAAAYSYLGAARHPEVQEAMAQVFAAASAAGKPIGILAPVEADARRYMQMGATFVAVGSDLGVLRTATQALKDRYRDADAVPVAAQY
jgi:2-dehydro-3-deoxyglucarate aldolase